MLLSLILKYWHRSSLRPVECYTLWVKIKKKWSNSVDSKGHDGYNNIPTEYIFKVDEMTSAQIAFENFEIRKFNKIFIVITEKTGESTLGESLCMIGITRTVGGSSYLKGSEIGVRSHAPDRSAGFE